MFHEGISFSVIVPLYNKAAQVRRCLESVCRQAGVRFEIVVVDDGSTDDGAAVVAGMGDPRIRLVRQENRGAAAARNRGAALARHDLLAFLDADDEWEPQFLPAMADLARRYPEARLYGSGFVTCGDGRRYCGRPGPEHLLVDLFDEWTRAPILNASSVVVRRDGFQVAGGFPEELRYNEDWVFFFRLALHYPVAYCRRPLARYHTDIPAQATRALASDLPAVLPYVRWLDGAYEEYGADESFARFCRHAFRWTLFACIRRFGLARLPERVAGLRVERVLPVEGFLLRRKWLAGLFALTILRHYLPHFLRRRTG